MLAVALYAGLVFAAPTSVNVNRADAQTIAEVLKGVGLRRAQAIVAYREENGEFRDVYELSNIKGLRLLSSSQSTYASVQVPQTTSLKPELYLPHRR